MRLFLLILLIPHMAKPKEVLNDWFALGSGCKAKSDLAGNVTMERLTTGSPSIHRIKFTVDALILTGEAPSQRSPLNFAKECSIRLNVNPPPGKRLKRIKAKTMLKASKGPEVDLLLNGSLKIGTTLLGYVREIGKSGMVLSNKAIPIEIDTDTGPVGKGSEPMPELSCGQAKIIGFDYTFIAKRKSQVEHVLAELPSPRTLELTAELETCQNNSG